MWTLQKCMMDFPNSQLKLFTEVLIKICKNGIFFNKLVIVILLMGSK